VHELHCYISARTTLLHFCTNYTVTFVHKLHCYICGRTTLLHLCTNCTVTFMHELHCYICAQTTLLHLCTNYTVTHNNLRTNQIRLIFLHLPNVSRANDNYRTSLSALMTSLFVHCLYEL